MYFLLFVGVLCLSFCFAMHYFVSLLVLQSSSREREAGCFAFIIVQMNCYYKCSVALPHGAVGWSAVFVIVVFPDHTLFLNQ